MIVNDARTFFVHGYKCEIEHEGRESYKGYFDGEELTSSHNTSHLRDELIEHAKWNEETEIDESEVAKAVLDFLDKQTDRDGNHLWVYNDVVVEQVTPLDSVGPAYTALLILHDEGLVEQGKICMELNVEKMWRFDENERVK